MTAVVEDEGAAIEVLYQFFMGIIIAIACGGGGALEGIKQHLAHIKAHPLVDDIVGIDIYRPHVSVTSAGIVITHIDKAGNPFATGTAVHVGLYLVNHLDCLRQSDHTKTSHANIETKT